MTVTTAYTPTFCYGSGTTGPFQAVWPIPDKTYLVVTKLSITGIPTVLTEGVAANQYSAALTALGVSGVQVTLNTALAVGETLILERETPRIQPEKITDQGNFFPAVHEREFDRLTMMLQENEIAVLNSIKFPTTDPAGLNQTLPAASVRALKLVSFDASGNVTVSTTDAANVIAAQAAADAATAQAVLAASSATAAQTAANNINFGHVRAATTANLSVTYNNGTGGIGATLTATSNGVIAAQDGVTLAVDERLLVKDQSVPSYNGIYTLSYAGSGGNPYILTRATDNDTWTEMIAKTIVVEEGTISADTIYICTANRGGVMGSTANNWITQPLADGAVSTAAKLASGIVSYAKLDANLKTNLAVDTQNLLINPMFDVNQRAYAGGAVGAANTYTWDRWRVITSGQTFPVTAFVGTAPAGGVDQTVEGISIVGGNYVLSWTGSATATVNGGAVTNGTPFSLTAGANAVVKFSNGTVSFPVLQMGNTATPFQRRHYGQEVALCQRYYYAATLQVGVAAGGIVTSYIHPVRMRITPTSTGGGAGYTQTILDAHGVAHYQTTGGTQAFTFSAEF